MDKGLKEYLAQAVDELPVADPHSHLSEDKISGSLMEVAAYHWIMSEFHSVGMDYEILLPESSLSDEEKLAAYVPYFKKINNTASAWCVKRVFADLYGFRDELDESNYRELLNCAARETARPDWADYVVKKTNIKKFVTSVGNATRTGAVRPDFGLMVDLHYLFNPSMALDVYPWFGDYYKDETKYLDALEKIGGRPVRCARDINAALEAFLVPLISGRTRYFNVVIFSEFLFALPDAVDVDRIVDRNSKGMELSSDEMKTLVAYTTWNILKILDSMRATLQICAGAEYQVCGGRSLSQYRHDWVGETIKTCYKFPNIQFDFMTASAIMYHELAVAAKMIRNVHLETMWWHTYVPALMENLYLGLEIVPLPKLGGFFCDGYYVEFTYAKFQMFKKALVNVLARKVEEDYFTPERAVAVAGALLMDNPSGLYHLDG